VLAAFGIFAVGYLWRPIGGALIGHIGGKLGRPTALTFSVVAMAVPTFLVGVLPGYELLGIMAPVLLTALRAIQGLSVGGEYTASIVFMVEHAPPGRRGLIGAVACCGAAGGILLGSATGAVLAAAMPFPRHAPPARDRAPCGRRYWSGGKIRSMKRGIPDPLRGPARPRPLAMLDMMAARTILSGSF